MAASLIDVTKPQPYVAAVLQYISKGTVLDIGAGWGRNARFFADHGFSVTAVDHSPEAVAQLASYHTRAGRSITAICADIRAFTSGATYDVVLCTMVLHFLRSRTEVAEAVGRIQAMTKPGGLNVISLFTDRNPRGLRPYLASKNELRDYYASWKLIDAYEGLGQRFLPQPSGPPTRHYASRITAQHT
jgi:2-polyprenyl-3-methyl-5-hydroxy-6-metoxy-1,4-benzoquinol methylase